MQDESAFIDGMCQLLSDLEAKDRYPSTFIDIVP